MNPGSHVPPLPGPLPGPRDEGERIPKAKTPAQRAKDAAVLREAIKQLRQNTDQVNGQLGLKR